jgi:hypothetical protein
MKEHLGRLMKSALPVGLPLANEEAATTTGKWEVIYCRPGENSRYLQLNNQYHQTTLDGEESINGPLWTTWDEAPGEKSVSHLPLYSTV